MTSLPEWASDGFETTVSPVDGQGVVAAGAAVDQAADATARISDERVLVSAAPARFSKPLNAVPPTLRCPAL